MELTRKQNQFDLPMLKQKQNKTASDVNTIYNLEKKIYVVKRIHNGEKIYDQLYMNMRNYLVKLSDSYCKKIVTKLLSENRVLIGSKSKNVKTGIYGSASVKNNTFYGVVLDYIDLDIDLNSGNTIHIDKCIYVAYFQYLRSICYCLFKDIRVDNVNIHDRVSLILSYIYFRGLKLQPMSPPKYKLLTKMCVEYFYQRFALNKEHPLALEVAVQKHDTKNLIKDYETVFAGFKNYKKHSDIFKGLKDLNIINNVSATILDFIKMYSVSGFYNITTTFDYLLSAIILSLYPTDFLNNMLIDRTNQMALESIIVKNYGKKLKYGSV